MSDIEAIDVDCLTCDDYRVIELEQPVPEPPVVPLSRLRRAPLTGSPV